MKLKVALLNALAVFSVCVCSAQPYFVSPDGNDQNPGTLEKPFAMLQRAQLAVRHPVDQNKINFSIEGDDKIIGVGNGDASCYEPDTFAEKSAPEWSRSLFNGHAQIIVQSTRDAPGDFASVRHAGGRSNFRREADNLMSPETTIGVR